MQSVHMKMQMCDLHQLLLDLRRNEYTISHCLPSCFSPDSAKDSEVFYRYLDRILHPIHFSNHLSIIYLGATLSIYFTDPLIYRGLLYKVILE